MTEKRSFQDEFGFAPTGAQYPRTRKVEQAIVTKRLDSLKAVVGDIQKALDKVMDMLGGSEVDHLTMRAQVQKLEAEELQVIDAFSVATTLAKEAGFSC